MCASLVSARAWATADIVVIALAAGWLVAFLVGSAVVRNRRTGERWEPKAAVISVLLFFAGFFSLYIAFGEKAGGGKSIAGAVFALIAWSVGAVLGIFSAVSNYRRTMRRNWPKVPPVEGDDEER